jgi:hypothetical protein
MLDAQDIRGRVFQNASATLLARITDADGDNIVPDDIGELRYSVLAIDPVTPNTLTPVEGHDDVALDEDEIFFATLQTDPPWDLDETGYNFRHDIDVTTHEAFPNAGVEYQVRYEVTPVAGQKVVFRFLLRCL